MPFCRCIKVCLVCWTRAQPENYNMKWNNTYVDAVLVRRVIIGLGNCNCELWNERFGELSGDAMITLD